jgi:hypothetical protein
MAVVTAAPLIQVTDAAWGAMEGGYDLQAHVHPDGFEQRANPLDLAQEFLKNKLKGFALKSDYIPTYECAKVVTRAHPGISAFGTIALNHSVGGLNPVAVEIAGRSGNKIVRMPTVDAAKDTTRPSTGSGDGLPYRAKIQSELAAQGILPPPITVLGDDGKLNEAARRCLESIVRHDMILATGHLGRKEIYQVVKTSREMGLKRLVVTNGDFPVQDLSIQEQVELANLGACIEHCFTTMYDSHSPWDIFFESVRQVGPERVILSTGLGQTSYPPVALGLAMFGQKLLDAGFQKTVVRRMAVINPATLLS